MLLRLMGVNAFAARGWGDSGDGGIGNRGSDRNSDGSSGSKGSSGSEGGDTNGRDSNGGNDRGTSGRGGGGGGGNNKGSLGNKGSAFGDGSDVAKGFGFGGSMDSAVGKTSFGGISAGRLNGADKGFGAGVDAGGKGALGGGAIPGRDSFGMSSVAQTNAQKGLAALGLDGMASSAMSKPGAVEGVTGFDPSRQNDLAKLGRMSLANPATSGEIGKLSTATAAQIARDIDKFGPAPGLGEKALGVASNIAGVASAVNPGFAPVAGLTDMLGDKMQVDRVRAALKAQGFSDAQADAAVSASFGRDKAIGTIGGMAIGATGLPAKAAKAAFGATGDMAVANAASKATAGGLNAAVSAGFGAAADAFGSNESFGAYSDRVAASKPDHIGKAPGEGGNGREEPWFSKLQAQLGGNTAPSQPPGANQSPNTGPTPPAQAIPPKVDYVGGMANSDMGMGTNANYRPSLANSYGSTGASGAYYGNAPASRASTPQHANGTVRLG